MFAYLIRDENYCVAHQQIAWRNKRRPTENVVQSDDGLWWRNMCWNEGAPLRCLGFWLCVEERRRTSSMMLTNNILFQSPKSESLWSPTPRPLYCRNNNENNKWSNQKWRAQQRREKKIVENGSVVVFAVCLEKSVDYRYSKFNKTKWRSCRRRATKQRSVVWVSRLFCCKCANKIHEKGAHGGK